MSILNTEYYNSLSIFVKDQFGLHFPRERQIDLERELKSICPALGVKDLFTLVDLINSKELNPSQLERIDKYLTVND